MRKLNDHPLKVYSVRLEIEQMDLASFFKIDTAELFRRALSEEILKRQGNCPHCGHKRMKENKVVKFKI